MHSYYGHVRSQLDAILLFEACRLGLLPRIRRRLSERERLEISSGKIYIWDEQEAGMRRWTDGKSWSASRVSGAFLSYREMDTTRRASPEVEDSENISGKRALESSDNSPPGGNNGFSMIAKRRKKAPATEDPNIEETEEGYRYKKNGLNKQSFSITTSTNLKLHLISYYCKDDLASGKLIQPCMDAKLKNIVIPVYLYPDAPPGGGMAVPALTNVPLEPHRNSITTPPGSTSSRASISPILGRDMKRFDDDTQEQQHHQQQQMQLIKNEGLVSSGAINSATISPPSSLISSSAATTATPSRESPPSRDVIIQDRKASVSSTNTTDVSSSAASAVSTSSYGLTSSAGFSRSSGASGSADSTPYDTASSIKGIDSRSAASDSTITKGVSLPPFVQVRTELFAEDKRVINILDRSLIM